jgi:hypothetical protein
MLSCGEGTWTLITTPTYDLLAYAIQNSLFLQLKYLYTYYIEKEKSTYESFKWTP